MSMIDITMIDLSNERKIVQLEKRKTKNEFERRKIIKPTRNK